MAEDKKLTVEEAEKLIESVLGPEGHPTIATRPMDPGDIALVFRQGGGTEILSYMPPDMKGRDGKPLDMQGIGMRGLFAFALYKIAHHTDLMADTLQIVSGEQGGGITAPVVRN